MSDSWTASVEVWKKHDLSAATFGTVFKRKPDTPWIRRNKSGKLEINISHEEFHSWLVPAVAKSKLHKKSKEARAENVAIVNSSYSGEQNQEEHCAETDPELVALAKASKRATLEVPILANEDKGLSIEIKKVKLKSEAGELMDSHTVNFLYIGFMEKTSVEMIRSPKKIQPKIETNLKTYITRSIDIQKIEDEVVRQKVQEIINQLPLHKISVNIVNELMREQEQIVVQIKKAQSEALDSYYENLDQLKFA